MAALQLPAECAGRFVSGVVSMLAVTALGLQLAEVSPIVPMWLGPLGVMLLVLVLAEIRTVRYSAVVALVWVAAGVGLWMTPISDAWQHDIFLPRFSAPLVGGLLTLLVAASSVRLVADWERRRSGFTEPASTSANLASRVAPARAAYLGLLVGTALAIVLAGAPRDPSYFVWVPAGTGPNAECVSTIIGELVGRCDRMTTLTCTAERGPRGTSAAAVRIGLHDSTGSTVDAAGELVGSLGDDAARQCHTSVALCRAYRLDREVCRVVSERTGGY